MLNDYGKLLILCIALVGAIILLATHTIEDATGVGIITGVIGYVTGNGRLAQTGKEPAPLFKPVPED